MSGINSEWVAVARQARGMTQAQLAESTGLAPAKLSRIENGLADPTDEEIERISVAVGFDPQLFREGGMVRGPGVSTMHHRALKKARARDVQRVHARLAIFDVQLKRVLRVVEPEEADVQIPDTPVGSLDEDVAAVAREVRAKLGLPVGPVTNLIRVIEKSGGLVATVDFETDAISAIYRFTPGLPLLFFVNARHSGDRTRFSLAHELGHATMHRDLATEDDRVEVQADAFAAEFLVPGKVLVERIKEPITLGLLARLKQEFRVSMQMLLRQCLRTSLISDRRYKNLMIEMSSRGWRRAEPVNIDPEQPELLPSMVDLLRQRLGFTPAELAKLVYLRDANELFDFPNRELRQGAGPRLVDPVAPGELRIA